MDKTLVNFHDNREINKILSEKYSFKEISANRQKIKKMGRLCKMKLNKSELTYQEFYSYLDKINLKKYLNKPQ